MTARLSDIEGCPTEEITKKSLLEDKIPYDALFVHAINKLELALQEKVDIFLEDSYETCVELEKHGIKTFLMTTKMNEKIDDPSIDRVSSWKELGEKLDDYLKKVDSLKNVETIE